MLTAFLTTLEQMVRITLFLVAGFGLNRLHILPKKAETGISRLSAMVLLPAMLIHSNMTEFNLANVGSYGALAILGCVLWTAVTVPCIFVANRISGGNYQERGIYLYGLSFPNSSAVGRPLVLALMGSAAMIEFNIFLLMFVIMTYAWGVGLFLDTERKNPIKRFFVHLLNPICISMVIGLTLGALGAKQWMPGAVTNFMGDLGSCFIPISLLMVGYMMGDQNLPELLVRPKSYIFAALRLIVIPVVVLLIGRVLGIGKDVAILTVFAFACPSGMNVVVFPAAYGQDCKTGASIVLVSSLGALVTVPLMYALVQVLF